MFNPLRDQIGSLADVRLPQVDTSAFMKYINPPQPQPQLQYNIPQQYLPGQQQNQQGSNFNVSDVPQTGRTGGSRSWRNANPGNLKYGSFAKKHGAIGKDKDGFAIFPNEQVGRGAMGSLLRGGTYGNLPVAKAISRYAPSFENDVGSYIKATGMDPNMRIADMDDARFNTLLSNMIKHEGWKPGRIAK
jgi:hypothetical protein